jgi:hypothetical protein
MSFWQILGRFAFSDQGETIHKVSDTTSVSSDGTTYTRMGSTTVGSDGSVFTQTGSFSSDGSTRMGSTATGLGAVFNNPRDDFGVGSSRSRDGFDGF